ncbi:MAG: non-hydrolyzing UDP-N-acetylglucosamine 2-epimerase [Dehalococcoidia bacterium]
MIGRPVVVAGARPNFVKVAPLMRSFASRGIDAALVHTGQHYDSVMSGSFFESLGIPEPIANLGVGSGSHAVQTAAVMVAFEEWLSGADADAVLVVGDVNSTVACALVAAKAGIPVGHIEAGLRSFDRSMPEEVNRVMVDAVARWLFTPSADADENLLAEGVEPARIHRVGNIMVDSLLGSIERARLRPVRAELGLPDPYGLVTLHRPALVDSPERMRDVMRALDEVGASIPLAFPVHPRTRTMLDRAAIAVDPSRIRLVEPQPYLDFLALEAGAALVLTDSGGVQEETTVLGVPCLTLRENTERPITITHGTNTLVRFDHDAIVAAARAARSDPAAPAPIPLWDGLTSERIVDVLTAATDDPMFVPPAVRGLPAYLAGRSPETIAAASG